MLRNVVPTSMQYQRACKNGVLFYMYRKQKNTTIPVGLPVVTFIMFSSAAVQYCPTDE